MNPIKLESGASEIEAYSDEALLQLMADKETDSIRAKRSFDTFYVRYSEYLWKVCSIVCRTHPQSSELAKDVFQQTMTKVYLNAKSYNKNVSKVKTWISSIARNEFLNCLKGPQSALLFLEDLEIDATEIVTDNSPFEREEIPVSKVELALSKLSEKERVVLTTYMLYYDEGDPNKHLPDDVLENLCRYANASSENLRKIKSRALKKMKEELGNQSL